MHVGGIFWDLAKALIVCITKSCYLNYIPMEFEECLKIGSDPIYITEDRKLK